MKPQLRLVLLMGALILGTLPAVGCGGSECGEGTTEKDGTCVAIDDSTGDNNDVNNDTNNDSGITCGAGTVEENGVCVPDGGEVECGPKTTLNEDGLCVISADACEAGETLDPNSGNCVAGTAECGAGTALDGSTGTCVPTEEVCDTGTVFDEDSGLCLPGVSCSAGDVIVDGVCANPAEELASTADVTDAENNDPVYGGTAQELTVKGTGAQTVFTGTISAPVDLDADGEVDQDVDVFSFEATEGDWFEISLQSLGLPSPIFTVEGPNGFFRVSPTLAGPAAARQIVVPADGTYLVTVLPLSGVYGNFPVGGDDWNYVGSLKQIDTPTPAELDFSADVLAGSYGSLSDNFYKITGYSAGDLVTVTVNSADEGASGVFSSWNSATEFAASTDFDAGDSFNVIIPPTGELFVVVDWSVLEVSGASFEFSSELAENFQNVGILDDDSVTASAVETIEADESFSYIFTVNAGQVIKLTNSNDEGDTVYMGLRDANGNQLVADTSTSRIYWYSESGGTYIATIDNDYSYMPDPITATLTITTSTPGDLGAASIGDTISESVSDTLLDGESNFHLLTLNENVSVSGDFTTPADEDVDVYFLNPTTNARNNSFVSSGSESFTDVVLPSGTLLIQVRAYDDTTYDINLTFAASPQLEVEPNNSISEATPFDISDLSSVLRGTMTSGGEVDYYSVQLDADLGANEVFILDVAGVSSGSTEFACFLTDAAGTDVGTIHPDGITNGCLTMSDDLVAGETYYLKVERTYLSTSIGYNLTARIESGVLESEPNEDETSATAVLLDDLLTGGALFGNLPVNSDVDYFSFELAADQAADALLELNAERIGYNSTGGAWRVLDASLVEVASGNITSQLSLSGLTAGTYYLELTRTGSSSYWYDLAYKISATERAVVCGDGIVEGAEVCDTEDHCTSTCEWEEGYQPPLINDSAQGISSSASPVELRVTAITCDSVQEVTIDTVFGSASYSDNLSLELESPSGTVVVLHDRDQWSYDSSFSFTGNFPNTIVVDDPVGLSAFIGENGAGDWILRADNNWSSPAQFISYTLNLTCD